MTCVALPVGWLLDHQVQSRAARERARESAVLRDQVELLTRAIEGEGYLVYTYDNAAMGPGPATKGGALITKIE
jgi:hypothetical protein